MTGPTGSDSLDPPLTSLFERGLELFRAGEDGQAHQVASALLDLAPRHVGGMMLLLAAAGGSGDEATIASALERVTMSYERLLAIPEVVILFDSEPLAPVVRSRSFQELFAPLLRGIQRQSGEEDFAGRTAAQRVLETVRDAVRDGAIDCALEAAPASRPTPERHRAERLQLVDAESGAVLASLSGNRLSFGGRSPEADVRFAHPSVSRLHFAVMRANGAWIIQDLSTTNGTRLNGREVSAAGAVAQDGDELQVGDVVLDLVAAATVEPCSAPAPALTPEEPTGVTQTLEVGAPQIQEAAQTALLPAGSDPWPDRTDPSIPAEALPRRG